MAWRYRDSETGQFASAATWNRSHAHGGERYVRESDAHYGAEAAPSPEGLPPGFEAVIGAIPAEFLEAADDYFESGYEDEEADEYL